MDQKQTKRPEDLIRAWQPGFTGTATPLGSGHYNDSYSFEYSQAEYILRIAPPDETPMLFYEKKMMRAEPEIHWIVREKTSLPIPDIVCHDFSPSRDFLIMNRLPGHSHGYSHLELGQYVAELHKIKGKAFGYPDRPFAMGRSWPETFLDYAEKIFQDCISAGALSHEDGTVMMNAYRKHQGALEECEPCLLHLDLWYENILTQKNQITGILDFDRGMYGDPELEFAVLDTYATATPDFFIGYGRARPEGEKPRIRKILYLVYELIKYAFIRLARGGRQDLARSHALECLEMIKRL